MTLITALKYKNKIYYMENILDDNDIQVTNTPKLQGDHSPDNVK